MTKVREKFVFNFKVLFLESSILDMLFPYIQTTIERGDFVFQHCQSPYQSLIASISGILEFDATYNESVCNTERLYHLTCTSFNPFTGKYEIVGRIRTNKLHSEMYMHAMLSIFKSNNDVGLELIPGENWHALIVDFSISQINGIKKAFEIQFGYDRGERLFETIIQGCEVHYKRSCIRVKRLVAKNEVEEDAFYQACMKVITCKEKKKVQDIFDFLENKWPGSKNWVKFWNRERILSLFSAAYSKNPLREVIPNNTNAVESCQRLIKSNGMRGIVTQLCDAFQLDKRNFVECRSTLELGVALTYGCPDKFTVENRLKNRKKIEKKYRLTKEDRTGRAKDRRSDGITFKNSNTIHEETIQSIASLVQENDEKTVDVDVEDGANEISNDVDGK